MPRTAGVNVLRPKEKERMRESEREREREQGVDGGGKCAEGVLLVIGANLILPFARRGLY